MNDDDLLEELRHVAAEVDGPPEGVLAAARAAFALRPLHTPVATLTFDSWAREEAASGLRSAAGQHRHLAFATDNAAVSFEVDVTTRRIVGQVTPARRVRVEARSPQGSTTAETDEHGRFALDGVPAGPASVLISTADGEIVATEWLPL